MSFAPHQKDAYKIGHVHQYPKGTTEIYSNLTARSGKLSNVPGSKGIVFVGLQHFILDYLIREWDETFFFRPEEEVIFKYQRRVSGILGYEVDVTHMKALHRLGYLPIKIKSLPEGSFVPYGVPMLTIRNTLPDFYWVTNMLESVMSAELHQPITTATMFCAYRQLITNYAKKTGAPLDFVQFQAHDFSYRGMAGRHAAAISGFATLACGNVGTDTIAAIDIAEDFYDADADRELIGCSVNATEHSVMCAGGADNELETFRRLLEDIYHGKIVSVVSDSWDFWGTVTKILPALKDLILSREGKLVIRPDSGDPRGIICGTDDEQPEWPEGKGLIQCLWDIFGGTINEKGYKVLNPKVGAIYGDSITLERAQEILSGLEGKGFCSSNIVFGVGSYTYQLVTRDTHGMAVKSTHAVINGKDTPIFKDPKTGDGLKKSAKGYLMVVTDTQTGEYALQDQVSRRQEKHGCLRTRFCNGVMYNKTTLAKIRDRVAKRFK